MTFKLRKSAAYNADPNGRKIARDIFKGIFPNQSRCIWIQISLKLFPMAQLKKNSIGLENGMVRNRQQVNIWTNDGYVYERINASLGFARWVLHIDHLGWWNQ